MKSFHAGPNRRLLTTALLLALAPSVAAQTANSTQEEPAGEGQEQTAKTLDSVVVTGSRIARPELESVMPISVVDFEEVKESGRFTVYDALLLNPAVGPGLGEMNSMGQEYDKGVANIDLRGMGTNRSLVLVDGRRWVSGGARTAAVDLNTIPSALVERIETVTGGASAIYGADAVTGAVNVVMKKRMDGTSASFTTGMSEQGDARQTNFSLGSGFDFLEERAHLVFGVNYVYTDDIPLLDRFQERMVYQANPANTGPDDGIPDNIIIDFHQFYRSPYPTWCEFNGRTPCGNNAINGNWYQLIDGQVVNVPRDSYQTISNNDTGTQNGGPDSTFGIYDYMLLRDKSEKASAYANLEVQLTPELVWNTSFGYATTYVSGHAQWPGHRDDVRPTNWWGTDPVTGVARPGMIARLSDPYLPDSMRAHMQALGVSQMPMSRHYSHLPMSRETHRRDAISFGTDLSGRLTDWIDWQGFVRWGTVEDDITTTNMLGVNEWLLARDVTVDSAGNPICASEAARAAGCVPTNLYSTEMPSDAWLNYVMPYQRDERTKNSMLNAGFGMNGELFSLPAGSVRFAAGLEWREEKLDTRDDPDTAKLNNIIWSPGNDHALHPDMQASRQVSEVYGEVVVPVLSDMPGARKLDFEAAYRYSHYSDNPSTNTWKLGLIWTPFEGVSLRGVKGFSIRVPNFGELYSPIGMVTLGHISDPCQDVLILQDSDRMANCAATVPGWTGPLPRPNQNTPRVYTGGNPDLEPETSNSFSYGVVWQPSFVRGLDLTADYWEIDIENVITSIAYGTIMNNCVNASGGPDMGYCQFVNRHTTSGTGHQVGEVDYVQAQYANLAGRRTRGIDLGAHYGFDLGPGRYRIALNGTRNLERRVIAQRGSEGSDDAGQFQYPDFKATMLNKYEVGQFSFGLTTRYNSKSRYEMNDQSLETREMPYVPSYWLHDLNISWFPTTRYSVSLGIKNLTDSEIKHPVLRAFATTPHLSADTANSNNGSAYMDAIGRYFFVTLKADF
ncbi:TonB-dependent receptor [Pseudoxanthomonas daejeonensis]|uniref:TonB-dependent receptor domain-containing protein n=1 Tax=Pseudoxanthomonas daejeonensis TaxID=266062 RepID=UPI001F54098F|nr:TonB-dependent receptor [Pseudoxanthomonas daejeonensis]UNK58635.1 TonB-dependent receptor [Pseudoxanthomonas daejeonensis]